MVYSGEQVSMSKVWKEWQVHEDARKVYGTEGFVNMFWEMETEIPGRAMIW